MKKQYDITFYYKGDNVQYMEWTDMDNIMALKEFGFEFIPMPEKCFSGDWKDDGLSKTSIVCIGDSSKLHFEELRTFLNEKIEECGLDNLRIKEIYINAHINSGYETIYEEKGK